MNNNYLIYSNLGILVWSRLGEISQGNHNMDYFYIGYEGYDYTKCYLTIATTLPDGTNLPELLASMKDFDYNGSKFKGFMFKLNEGLTSQAGNLTFTFILKSVEDDTQLCSSQLNLTIHATDNYIEPTITNLQYNELAETIRENFASIDEKIENGQLKGDKGDKGDSGTVTIGATITGETGTPAIVENVGTPTDAILNFTLPRGEKGEKGDKGEPGQGILDLDDELSTTSTNPVQNKVLTEELQKRALIPETGNKLSLSINNSNYRLTISLLNKEGTTLDSKVVDLPLETMVVNAYYDKSKKEIVLTLQNGTTTSFSVADLVSGLVSQSDFNNLDVRVDTLETSVANNKKSIDTNTTNISNITSNKTNIKNGNNGFTAGAGAYATFGGAAIGYAAQATGTPSTAGNDEIKGGGAVGYGSRSADGSGSVGCEAHSSQGGFAGGYKAKTQGGIQLGEGTNNNRKTLQIYDDNIYNAENHVLDVQNARVGGEQVITKGDESYKFSQKLYEESVNILNLKTINYQTYGLDWGVENQLFNVVGTSEVEQSLNILWFDTSIFEIGETYSLYSSVPYNGDTFNISIALRYGEQIEYITPINPLTIKSGLTSAVLTLYCPSGITYNYNDVGFMLINGTTLPTKWHPYNENRQITNSQADFLKSEYEKTINLYANGDISGTTYKQIKLINPLKPGTYTMSGIIESSDTDAGVCLFGFLLSNGGWETSLYLNRNIREYKTVTLYHTCTEIIVYAGNDYESGKNDTFNFYDIQIEKGDGTPYQEYHGEIIHRGDIAPVTLFEGATKEAITLDTTGYSSLKIIYCDDNSIYNEVIVENTRKNVILFSGIPYVDNDSYLSYTNVLISDDAITPVSYSQWLSVNGSVRVQNVNGITIKKVLGYKEV